MKKVLVFLALVVFSVNCSYAKIISNERINDKKVEFATKVITDLQKDVVTETQKGSGPFVAAIYDDKGNLIAKTANSVVETNCSNNHAEMNVIRLAEEKLKTYDLSKYNLSIYITSEPCIMCIGAIMWSGIKAVYYGVPSKDVEKITGFDEGFKPFWFREFKHRGIIVYGNIEPEIGKDVLKEYTVSGKTIYKPER